MAGVVAVAVLVMRKGAAQSVGAAAGEAAGNFVAGAAGGVVLGIGDGLGVDRTNVGQCERDKAAGDTWAASFSCGAGDFVKWWWEK